MILCSALIFGHKLMLLTFKLSKPSLIVIAVTAAFALFSASGALEWCFEKYMVHQALSDYKELPDHVVAEERCYVLNLLISYASSYDREVFDRYYPEYQKLGCE